MAMRYPVSDEEARKLDEQKAPVMDEKAKLEFRIARDRWAEEGHLPEGYNAKEIEMMEKLRVIDVRIRSEGLGAKDREALAEQLQALLTEAGELRKESIISDGIHREVMDVVCSVLRGSKIVDR